jgi:hypothetical protein
MAGQHGFVNNDKVGGVHDLVNRFGDTTYNVGVLITADSGDIPNSSKEFPANKTDDTQFGGNWMNFTVFFLQNGRFQADVSSYGGMMSNTNFLHNADQRWATGRFHFIDANTQPIAASILNTQWYPRIDVHFTDIIEVPKEDILYFNGIDNKGANLTSSSASSNLVDPSNYRNGQSVVPVAGAGDVAQGSGKINADPNQTVDTNIYFYKGLDESNCTQFLADLGLV